MYLYNPNIANYFVCGIDDAKTLPRYFRPSSWNILNILRGKYFFLILHITNITKEHKHFNVEIQSLDV